ncbi:unnamed protein product [Camellia sinensis]
MCTFVELDEASAEKVVEEKAPWLPPNYKTCMNVFRNLLGLFRSLMRPRMRDEPTLPAHIEGPAEGSLFPPNYYMCFEFVNLISKTISKAMITILGCVSNEPRKVKREKEKHEWSLRTMHELIQHSSVESFADGGTRPRYETFDLPPPEVYE